MNDNTCRIETVDWIGSQLRGPEWTPYAQAIADSYPIQVPFFLRTTITLDQHTIPRVAVTRPYLYDALILGMSGTQEPSVLLAGMPYLQVTHLPSGVPWVSPASLAYAPLPAYTGFPGFGLTGASRLPEAFFLPRGTQLKFEWLGFALDVTPAVVINLTMIGVQLIDKPGKRQPEWITMPNGNQIRVGSRVPWFGTVPFGGRLTTRTLLTSNLRLSALTQIASYVPPQDCDVEVTDAFASFLDVPLFGFNGDTNLLQTKLDDVKTRSDWTPSRTPVPVIFVSFAGVTPQLPFPTPYLLRAKHKFVVTAQNNSPTQNVIQGTVTFRGVRRCEY